jgi:hypothetical protein
VSFQTGQSFDEFGKTKDLFREWSSSSWWNSSGTFFFLPVSFLWEGKMKFRNMKCLVNGKLITFSLCCLTFSRIILSIFCFFDIHQSLVIQTMNFVCWTTNSQAILVISSQREWAIFVGLSLLSLIVPLGVYLYILIHYKDGVPKQLFTTKKW